MKKIYVKKPYITLGKFLKFTNIIEHGSDAKQWLKNNNVLINNTNENRRGRKLYENDYIVIADQQFHIVFSNDE